MKRSIPIVFLLMLSLIEFNFSQTGRVGINTESPNAMLHVKDSSVVFTGAEVLPFNPGSIPVSGNGIRMMWYAGKAAFRSGAAENNSWEKDSIGAYSVAMGRASKAIGNHSSAFGYHTRAFGAHSTAMNFQSKAIGSGATAMGGNTIASGSYSFAGGYNSIAANSYSIALGYSAEASGNSGIALGYNTDASGPYSTSMGINTSATGNYATAFGNNTFASGQASTAMGQSTEATATNSTAIGYLASATNTHATAIGYSTSASGFASLAAGYQAEAINNYTTALGYNTTASGTYSTSLCALTHAMGAGSLAAGYSTKSSGSYSSAFGYNTNAKPYASFVLGRYNDTTAISSTSWNSADPVFVIGNGFSNSSRSNAFTVLKSGDVGIKTALPEYGLHMTVPISADGGWIDGIIIENTALSSTGEASLSLRNAGFNGTGPKFWHMGLNQDRYFRWSYGTGFLGAETKMALDTVGNLFVDGVYSSSDINLKTDIHRIDDPLQKISLINGYNYYWVTADKDPGLQTGVLAQEVEEVMPELVKTNEAGLKSINYDGIVPYLIEAVKKLKEQIDQLHAEIQQLKSDIKG